VGNQSVALLKQTSLISVVGLEELMRKAAIGAGATREPFTFYLAAAAIYMALSGALTLLYAAAQRRANRGLVKT
jgi:ABC-type arginine transport system permease subunit